MYDHEQPAALLDLMRQQNDLLAEIRDRLPPLSGDGEGQPVPGSGPQPVRLVEPKPADTAVQPVDDSAPRRRGRPPGRRAEQVPRAK